MVVMVVTAVTVMTEVDGHGLVAVSTCNDGDATHLVPSLHRQR